MNKQYNTIKWDIDDEGIAQVVLNRPKSLNALNLEMFSELDSLFDELKKNNRVRVVIITGEGDKAFAAGTDINMMKGLQVSEVMERALLVYRAQGKIENFPYPVIAAINGVALGGGCELAMACDIRIASASARFAQPEINLGIIPGGGGTQRLARLVGIGRARELVYSADIIDARRAYEIGLVNQVVAPEELLTAARRMALRIAGKSLPILSLAKQAINTGYDLDLDIALQLEMNCFKACFETHDQLEGMQAFAERRPPVFTDR